MTRNLIISTIAAFAAGAAVLAAFDDASARGFGGGVRGGHARAISGRAAMPRMGRMAAPRMNRMASPRTGRQAQPRIARQAQPRINRMAQPGSNRLGQPRINRLGQAGPARSARPRIDTNRGRQAGNGSLPRADLGRLDRNRNPATNPGSRNAASAQQGKFANVGNQPGRRFGPMASTPSSTPAAAPKPAPMGNGVKERARQKVITIRTNGWRLDTQLRAMWEFDSRVRLGARATPPLSGSEQKAIDDAGGTTEMIWKNKRLIEDVINRAIVENNEALRQAEEEARQAEAWRE